MAEIRVGVFLLLLLALAMAVVADSTASSLRDSQFGLMGHGSSGDGGLLGGHVGDFIDTNDEMMMENDSVRRSLQQGSYISYGALKKNNVPCNKRGQSYYNCQASAQANPYKRGCTVATQCARR